MSDLRIARRRLRNSRLTGTPFRAPEQVVRWHAAMQAQDYGPAKWSIGQRSSGLADADVDRSLAEGSIVRTHVLRPTWHFVGRDDVRSLLALSGPRVQQHNCPRYRELGLEPKTRARCERVIGAALEGGGRLTRDAVAEVLDRARIDRSGQRLPYILMHCELEAVICSGGLRGKQHTFALLDDRVPKGGRFDREAALIELVRRYLGSHGPATVQDLRWWSGMTMSDIREALHALGDEVRTETSDGLTLWSAAGDAGAVRSAGGAHLLQAFDELLVGYSESRHIGDPRAGQARSAWTDRSLPNGIVLVDGAVAGHWRRTLGRDGVDIEVLLYAKPTSSISRALETAADRLGTFLRLPATVHARRI